MKHSGKYLIHARIEADGVVERSDVVGAIFGQTEGLLGEHLELRNLQRASKVGRIDVEIDSQQGRSVGEVTIGTSLDKVETATVAAALETIDRVGPCEAEVTVTNIEDVRAAKRRQVVDRAHELLVESFDGGMTGDELIEEVRRRIRVEDITTYEGLPAGPNVETSDAIVVVEGRADVLQLLEAGVKNAIAVEGTDIPETVATLTQSKTVTAFFDADRGGELLLKELSQVGDIDYVAFPPEGQSVEDLSRTEMLDAMRKKISYASVDTIDEVLPTGENEAADTPETDSPVASTDGAGVVTEPTPSTEPVTVQGHVTAVINQASSEVRLLDDEAQPLATGAAEEVFELLADLEQVPDTIVLDGTISQRLLDLAAQRGVRQIIGDKHGEYTKRPTDLRVREAQELPQTS